MRDQIAYYKKMIKYIGNGKKLANDVVFEQVSFDWEKVSSDVDLWLSENKLNGIWQPEQSTLILDQGYLLSHLRVLIWEHNGRKGF